MKVSLLVTALHLAIFATSVQAQARGVPTRVVSTDGGFSVELPCVPTAPPPPPGPGWVQVECTEPEFYAGVTSKPLIMTEAPAQELDYESALVIQAVPGRLLSRDAIALGLHAGLSIRVATDQGLVAMSRLYLVEEQHRLFNVVAVARDGAVPEDRIAAFFKSFAVVDARPADLRPLGVTRPLATKTNRALPATIDAETELLATVGLDGVLAYQYRLVNLLATEIDVPRFVSSMKSSLVVRPCTDPRIREGVLRQGIALRHIYADRDLRQIAIIEVTAADCSAR